MSVYIQVSEKTKQFRNNAPILLGAPITWPGGVNTLSDIVNKILPIFYGVVGVVLFGLLLYGGFTWLTSAGDPDKIKKATDTMFNAVIGVGIIVFAYVATRIIAGFFGVPLI